MIRKLYATDDNTATVILRLVLGVVFFAHGAQKMLGWFGGYGFSATMGFFTGMMHIPAPLAFLAIVAEFFGGLGLILGLLNRIAAFGIGINMIVAIATVHGAFGFFMNWTGAQKGEGVEYHLLVLAMAVFLMIRGQVPSRLIAPLLSRQPPFRRSQIWHIHEHSSSNVERLHERRGRSAKTLPHLSSYQPQRVGGLNVRVAIFYAIIFLGCNNGISFSRREE